MLESPSGVYGGRLGDATVDDPRDRLVRPRLIFRSPERIPVP
ncbi:hypothetical protein N1027_00085 [Herbiconiux sp. CPCC 205763]|uniref:Uncharacterized protein n=1 Tax=Herbiconiux aconitum TaxID=2970913 RepID=A0ABT2GJZ0_9MICO|nr:hypothetical protein [Herbiconiux aconitum]MCS5716531.1 hypothetical protein [Herbiconiux aconitum]